MIRMLRTKQSEVVTDDHSRLIVLLKNHDWYYSFSDDQSSWYNGNAIEKKIHCLVDLLGEDGVRLYNEHAPEQFSL